MAAFSIASFAVPMLFFLISCSSCILIFKPFLNSFPQMKKYWKFTSWFLWESSSFLFYCLQKCWIVSAVIFPMKKINLTSKVKNVEQQQKNLLLDLPELVLECIFERLSPTELCSMAGVCTYLREMCSSDHLWEKHMRLKWGRVIGDAAYKEWQWHIASRWRPRLLNTNGQKGLFQYLFNLLPFSWISPEFGTNKKPRNSLPAADSIMALYVSLEKGKFWFPAQVYNRENGHVGFMLSCYDALLCYDFRTDSFQARYSPHGRRTIEENIHWERLRAPPIDTPSNVLHVSDCLHDLKPGDHIEIQWRRNKEFPYGWWYAVVGHLESCDGNLNYCHCHQNETVILEFNQFNPGSRWRRTIVNRKEHGEEGNETDGFYGGIRKLYKEEEISMWKSLWPTKVLE